MTPTEKLTEFLQSPDEAFILTSEINIFYFTGFKQTDGMMIFTRKEAYLLVDFRYAEAAAEKAENCRVVGFEKLNEQMLELLKKNNIKTVFLERQGIDYNTADYLRTLLAKNGFKPEFDKKLDKWISVLRMEKEPEELEKIEKAQRITELAYEHTLRIVKEGITERDLALELEFFMRKHGAERVAFDLITITGKKTSMPHGEPDEFTRVKKGDFITMDIGAVYKGYHSDMTRTFAFGFATEEMKNVYETVLKAQLAALKTVKAGALCSHCDKAARDVITSAGYGDYFKHSTGHGVGLEIHEMPVLRPNADTVLKKNMVITVEPGIYLPGKFGVRIEDMVAVTETGCYNFAKEAKNLIVIPAK